MFKAEATQIMQGRYQLAESPLWCSATETLYWIDMPVGLLCQRNERSGRYSEFAIGKPITNIVLDNKRQILIAGTRELFTFNPIANQLEPFLAPELPSGVRFNDGACDDEGRLWIGSMFDNLTQPGKQSPLPRTGGVFCVGTDRSFVQMIDNIGCPNAIAWSPDRKLMYFADSSEGRLYSCDYDSASGQLKNKQVFFDAREFGIPDGAAVDVEGNIWSARWGGGCVIQIGPDGTLKRIIGLDSLNATSCAFGGCDLRSLYITSAAEKGDRNGAVYMYRTDVPGLATHLYQNNAGND
jgi:sugar lactone lactonase YvrE